MLRAPDGLHLSRQHDSLYLVFLTGMYPCIAEPYALCDDELLLKQPQTRTDVFFRRPRDDQRKFETAIEHNVETIHAGEVMTYDSNTPVYIGPMGNLRSFHVMPAGLLYTSGTRTVYIIRIGLAGSILGVDAHVQKVDDALHLSAHFREEKRK
jgi:hypothetical protein